MFCRQPNCLWKTLFLPVGCLLWVLVGVLAAPPAVCQIADPESTIPDLGGLEEGLELLAAGKVKQAHARFRQTSPPELERIQWVLIELTTLYKKYSSIFGRFGEPAKSGRSTAVSRGQEFEFQQQRLMATIDEAPPREGEYLAVLAWTREILDDKGLEAPPPVRILHCHLRLLSDEVSVATKEREEEGNVQSPERLFDPRPFRVNRTRGTGHLRAWIDRDGCVQNSDLLKGQGSEELFKLWRWMLRWWVFQPAHVDGEPVPVFYRLAIGLTYV